MYIYTNININKYIYICMYTHTHIHIYIYIFRLTLAPNPCTGGGCGVRSAGSTRQHRHSTQPIWLRQQALLRAPTHTSTFGVNPKSASYLFTVTCTQQRSRPASFSWRVVCCFGAVLVVACVVLFLLCVCRVNPKLVLLRLDRREARFASKRRGLLPIPS